jgi:hypothetical protein
MSLVKLIYFATMILVASMPLPAPQDGVKTADRPQATVGRMKKGATQRIRVHRVETVRYNVR